jgi:uroporphyrinogen III methyltransferase/synthase
VIVLTTTKEKCQEISKQNPDYEFFHFPCIEFTAPADDYKALDAAIRSNHTYEWVFFLSPKAAESFFDRLLAIGGNFFNLSNHLKFAVIGKTTKDFIESQVNMPVDFMPSQANSQTFIEEFCHKYKYDFDCAFKVLLPRSELAKDDFKDKLEASKNYLLEQVAAYNTVIAQRSQDDINQLKALVQEGASLIFTSNSCVDNFVQITDKLNLDATKVYSIGAKTSKKFLEHYPGFDSLIEAEESNIESLLSKTRIC